MVARITKIEFLRRGNNPDGGIVDYVIESDKGKKIIEARSRWQEADNLSLDRLQAWVDGDVANQIERAKKQLEARHLVAKQVLMGEQERLVEAGIKRANDAAFLS